MGRQASEDLIRRFVAGDEAACRDLFERHARMLERRVARAMPARLRRRLSVSDILQETHLVAFQRRGDFEERGMRAFGGWLAAIADNKVREMIRRHAGTGKRAAGCEVTRGQRPDTGTFTARQPTPSQGAVAFESIRRLDAALRSLPGDYAEVLLLTRVRGLSTAEAAERMGRTLAATRKLYGRALYRLKECYERLEGAGDG